MNYCPGCQEPLTDDEHECPYCGYELIATKKEEANVAAEVAPKKPFYRRGIFIAPLIILIVASLIGAGAYVGLKYFAEQKKENDQKQITAIWSELNNRSDQFVSNLDLIEDYADLTNFNDELTSFTDFLSEKENEAINLEVGEKYEDNRQGLVEGIQKYNKYIYFLKLVLQKDLNEINDADYKKIRNLADEAEAANEKFLAEATFIEGKLPEEVFMTAQKIKPIIKKEQNKLITEEKKTKQQEQTAKKREAEKTVRLFMQARIDKSAAEIRRYITPDYDKVFDPEQEFAVTDTYSIDFKITSTVEKSPTEFEINGDEIGKDLTGAKFTNKWWFKVISFENDWLIDNRKLIKE